MLGGSQKDIQETRKGDLMLEVLQSACHPGTQEREDGT